MGIPSQAQLSPFSAERTGKARRSHGHVLPSGGRASPYHGSPAGTLEWRGPVRGGGTEERSLGLGRVRSQEGVEMMGLKGGPAL